MTKSIPFEVKMPSGYIFNEVTAEVRAPMAMENMPLTDDDVQLLRRYQASANDEKDNMRNKLIAEYMEE